MPIPKYIYISDATNAVSAFDSKLSLKHNQSGELDELEESVNTNQRRGSMCSRWTEGSETSPTYPRCPRRS